MPIEIIISFLAFVTVSGITPGPANLTSLATSLQFGRRSALRQWIGLLLGCTTDAFISVGIVYFLGAAFTSYVKWFAFVGAGYLVYLSIHILRMNYNDGVKEIKEPGFLTGYLLQLTNVKIILTCITALSSYVLPNTTNLAIIMLFGLALSIIQPTCNLVWLFTGLSLQKFFQNHRKAINIIMAVALFLCALSLIWLPFKN